MDALQECQVEIRRLRSVVRELQDKREFYIDTPLGKLKVWAKHKIDTPEDYPGVFVDIVTNNDEESIMLACVEYDSSLDGIYTRVYGDGLDDAPTESVRHENYESL